MGEDNKLIEYITTKMARGKGTGNLAATDDLIELDIIDSLGLMKLIQFLEENFSVSISDLDVIPENFTSIMAINSLIERKRSACDGSR